MVITKYDDYLLDQILNESMMNEKINIDKIISVVKKIGNKKESIKNIIKKFNNSKNLNTKKYLAIILITLVIGNLAFKNSKWTSNNGSNINKAATELINTFNEKGDININDVDAVSYLNVIGPPEAVENLPIISMGTPGLIDDVNKVKKGRLDSSLVWRYDYYDKEILDALNELKSKGETPDANLIKIIMIIETGMNPVKNSLGYEGFPQTKQHIINGWTDDNGKFHPGINQKHGTNFTMADMYKAGPSAQFIYYYLKSVFMSDYVDDIPDMLIAYNWGARNLGKYKKGEKNLPEQSASYVSMYNAMASHFDDVPVS